jgi:hypothetical protein
MELLCMMCGQPANDAYEQTREFDHDTGTYYWGDWVYCRACDCWTEHPVKEVTPNPAPADSGITKFQIQ